MAKSHVAAEQAVGATNFIAKNRASIEALKSANLLKSLEINAIILGEEAVGKTTLAKYIIDAPVVYGDEDLKKIDTLASQHKNIIIKDFDKIKNEDTLYEILKRYKTRIIATSKQNIQDKVYDKFFSLSINIPPLKERKEDIYPLSNKFLEEAKRNFGIKDMEVDIKKVKLSLKRNCYSLKLDIYKYIIEQLLNESDILDMLENLLIDRLGSKNDYRNNLYIYEIPLIKAGFKKYKFQLQIAEQFGINRNTLRKKINEYKL